MGMDRLPKARDDWTRVKSRVPVRSRRLLSAEIHYQKVRVNAGTIRSQRVIVQYIPTSTVPSVMGNSDEQW